MLNQFAALESEKATLNTEILGLRNSIYTNNEIIRKKHLQLRTLDRKFRQLEIMLQNANKDPNYHKVKEIVDQRLNDKRSLLVAALIAVLQTLNNVLQNAQLLDLGQTIVNYQNAVERR